jgi:hypothetical protein
MLPCWDLYPCDEEKRGQCSAFREANRPCWMIRCLPCSEQGMDCRDCLVYRFGSLCTEDIKRLLHDEESAGDMEVAIRKLLENREPDRPL